MLELIDQLISMDTQTNSENLIKAIHDSSSRQGSRIKSAAGLILARLDSIEIKIDNIERYLAQLIRISNK